MNIAFITQTYKPDFNECKMLCRSMDIFANTYDHLFLLMMKILVILMN